MVSKLKIIPLGGLGEIGKNMTAFEYGNDIIVVDCGMGFPDEDMYGIDIVLPDFTYLKNKHKKTGERNFTGLFFVRSMTVSCSRILRHSFSGERTTFPVLRVCFMSIIR